MIISSVLIYIDPGMEDGRDVVAAVDQLSGVTGGRIHGARLPALIEAEDARSARESWGKILKIPGIASLNLIQVHYLDDELECET